MSHRIEQINEVLRHEISQLLLAEVEFPIGCLVTVLRADTSKDLRHSKIFISVLPKKFTGKVLLKLQKHVGPIQFQLNKKLRMRPLPRIRFVVDETEHKAADIEDLLDQIKHEQA